MVESERSPIDEGRQALIEVRKFVTRVWEHPLVDKRLKEHRQEAKRQTLLYLEKHGIDKDSFVGIPVGSTRTIVNEESDFDVVFIAKDMEAFKKMAQIHAFQIPKEAPDFRLEIGNIIPPYVVDSCGEGSVHLLFTPDEYLLGNLEFAKEARLRIIRGIKRQFGDEVETEWGSIEAIFNRFYKEWHLSERKKTDRFRQVMNRRSKQTHVPQRWSDRFLKSLRGMKVPDYQTFSFAMEHSGGALELLPRYRSQGIREKPAV